MAHHNLAASSAPLVALAAMLVVPEVVLTGADHGLWGFPDWRGEAYRYGAFWSGLLVDWRPLFAQQPWLMFASHGFLHGGMLHLLMNVATLVSLGLPILREHGAARFLALYGVAQIAGGLGFAWLGPEAAPMVGASGALFGLAGAWVAWSAVEAWRASPAPFALIRMLVLPSLALAVLNLVMYVVLDGRLAWQTHLAGYVAGLLAAPLLNVRRQVEALA